MPENEVTGGSREGLMYGLSGRLALLYAAAVLVVIGVAVVTSITSLTEAFDQEYREKAQAIVRTFDAKYVSLAEIQDARVTQEHIDRLVASSPNIYQMSLYVPVDDSVVRMASSDRSQVGEVASPYDAEPIRTGRTVFYDKVRNGEKLVEVLAPLHVNDQPVAALGVYLRLGQRDEAVRGLTVRFAYIGVVAALLLVVVLYFSMNRLLLKPISLLKQSALEIGRGQLNTRIALRRSDELGELASAFNGMADALAERERENRQLHKQLQQKYDEAQAQAVTDPVTGLYNHRYFQDRLAHELERARRFGTTVTLLFLDIDQFKAFNDRHGHQFGDQALREVAHLIKGAVREVDIVARYGGEEFTVILPTTDRWGGQQMGERIRRVIDSYQFFGSTPNLQHAITISVGVASYPEDGSSREDLIWKADRAMYYAKRLGRNQVRLYGELLTLAEAEGQRAT